MIGAKSSFLCWTLILLLASALRPPPSWDCSPRALGDALAEAGPLLALLPLWHFRLRGAQRVRNAALHRTLLLSLCTWLLFIGPIRSVKRAARVLFGARVDPSGHIFLFGVQLVPMWVAQRESGAGGGSRRDCGVAALALRGAEGVLLFSSFTTAAYHHSAMEVFAAWACVAALQLAVEVSGPAPSRREVAAVGGVWAALTLAFYGVLVAHNALPPAAIVAGRAVHDACVLAAALLLA